MELASSLHFRVGTHPGTRQKYYFIVVFLIYKIDCRHARAADREVLNQETWFCLIQPSQIGYSKRNPMLSLWRVENSVFIAGNE